MSSSCPIIIFWTLLWLTAKNSLRRKIKKTYKTKDKSHREKAVYGVREKQIRLKRIRTDTLENNTPAAWRSRFRTSEN
ncbi:MAG: hypothetical protein PWP57_1071 [Candidatus Atribacteria bacterium]|nr:hypothetical protein [Candidatus Atribacteria bacterium]